MDVREVQQRLKDLGYAIAVDGISGPQTKAVIQSFQRDNDLTPDGVVGKNTRKALISAARVEANLDGLVDNHPLSAECLAKLEGVHPKMVKVVKRAYAIAQANGTPFTVGEGVRTRERQRKLYAKGRTAPGRKVTWTMNSKHMLQDCGYGVAVDLYPQPLDWNKASDFIEVGECVNQAAAELGIETVWGYNWDDDDILNEAGEYDGPHHELKGFEYE